MKVVQSLKEKLWLHFISHHPESNIFHTPAMFQVFAKTKGYNPSLWAVTNNERVLALLLPVQITLAKPLQRLTTRAVIYGSILCASGQKGKDALSLLLKTYVREVKGSPLFTEFRNLSDLKTIQPILQNHGFVYEDHLNHVLDLHREPETILQGMKRGVRKEIRRGLRRQKVMIEEVTKPAKLSCVYELLCRTYQRAGIPLVDFSLFKAVFEVLYPQNMVRFFLAFVDSTPVATSVELIFKDTIYGWYGGMDRTYSSYIPNELLMWHVLRWGAENNYRLYDFGGSGKPDEEYGVRDFKAKFGGELICYGRNTYVHSPLLLNVSKTGYMILKKSFSRVNFRSLGRKSF